MFASTAFALFLTLASGGDGFPHGVVVPKVVCTKAPRFSYALYLPKSLPAGPVPVLMLFDPAGDGLGAVRRFQDAAEATGTALVGSLDSRNGLSWAEFGEILPAFWNDVASRFPGGLRFVGGFSGGARIALGMTLLHPGEIQGLFSAGAFYDVGTELPPPEVPVFMVGGDEDRYLPEQRQANLAMKSARMNSQWIVFNGGHQWPPDRYYLDGLTWLRQQVRKMKTER